VLFNSYLFIFVFLPAAVGGYYLANIWAGRRVAILYLILASLFYYSYWNPAYFFLIGFSICMNYLFGIYLSRLSSEGQKPKALLAVGVGANLAIIGYYKYANFFADNLNELAGTSFHLDSIILPLAISFFTFQQIAYLVDAFKGKLSQNNFVNYCLFVTFFPQLIAGPIVHHKEMLPQFAGQETGRLIIANLSIGLTIFFVGLFKKVVMADNIAMYATVVFEAAENGVALTMAEAWAGSLAYSLQIYFDFSGYSDMAIGLAQMFGIRLPLNFHSPYKAVNIIEFWRRWHMTLSRFLREYLYFPLGGSWHGSSRRYANVAITMILGGLWHGAGWTFIIWGGLHGAYIIVNHAWQNLRTRVRLGDRQGSWLGVGVSRSVTFLSVTVAWVFFRAESLEGAMVIVEGMSGINGWMPVRVELGTDLLGGKRELVWLLALVGIAWFAPNTQQIMADHKPAAIPDRQGLSSDCLKFFRWQPSLMWSLAIGAVALAGVIGLTRVSEFLYFQF
jgi:alginate O-acetyltransferase complex protein AlgI